MPLHQSYRNERIASDGDGHQQFQASFGRFRIRQTALETSALLKREIWMTSEILLLNKRGVVIGADSAATTSSGTDHPRYSKSANKIFELARHGSMAAAVFGSASIDGVPWELAIKQFRSQLGSKTFGQATEYATALIGFLTANDRLFPEASRERRTIEQFDLAINEIARLAHHSDPSIFDVGLSLAERRTRWAEQAADIRDRLVAKGVAAPLTEDALRPLLHDLTPWIQRVATQFNGAPPLSALDVEDVAELAMRLRYASPQALLPSTGLIVAGYGDDQLSPAYAQLEVVGHVGEELFYRFKNADEVTLDSGAVIQPLAMSSMINVFTDGFDRALENIVDQESRSTFEKFFQKLRVAGVNVPHESFEEISNSCQRDFMSNWKRLNWQRNRSPLLGILQSLSIEEMALLAASLLELQSLKERMTSPTESVGGPIDVAAITKEEGLVWIHRKHFFDINLNMRYAARLHHSLA
jgi:hypothetical protein